MGCCGDCCTEETWLLRWGSLLADHRTQAFKQQHWALLGSVSSRASPPCAPSGITGHSLSASSRVQSASADGCALQCSAQGAGQPV